MYTYNRIKKIRDDLRGIIYELKSKELLGLSDSEILHFGKSIQEYDNVLNKIGIRGTCDDKILIAGMRNAEMLIDKINLSRNK
ncbi:MAG: hypothetical protein ACTTKL_09770 [Treponema sp.]